MDGWKGLHTDGCSRILIFLFVFFCVFLRFFFFCCCVVFIEYLKRVFSPQLLNILQAAHKTLKIKKVLGKKLRQNRPLPQWQRFRTGATIK